MCSLRVRNKNKKISVINVHVPSEEKDIFYQELEAEYKKFSQHDLKVIIGDCNTKTGTEEMYRPTIGKHSKHEILKAINNKFFYRKKHGSTEYIARKKKKYARERGHLHAVAWLTI